jgi:hypothetical protein
VRVSHGGPEILGLEEVSDEDLCPRLGEGVSSVILTPHESVHGVALFEELARDRRARISRRSSYQNSGFARHDVISFAKTRVCGLTVGTDDPALDD